jgi:membrane fusion protein (multidrug efflux system)
MKYLHVKSLFLICLTFGISACSHHGEHHQHEQPVIVVTNPIYKDVTIKQQYVCLINSRRHIVIRAQQKEAGYLDEIHLKEGDAVEAGQVLFQIIPTLYKARLDAELAEVQLAQQEYNNTKKLFEDRVVSDKELALFAAKLAKAKAKAAQAQAELNFTTVRAPFDGIIDRLHEQQGSLIKEGDKLTTLSDNKVMWVYFNVPEAQYLNYLWQVKTPLSNSRLELPDSRIELILANNKPFPYDAGNIVSVEGEFNRETGNIPFRADFPNPNGLLRHGQTGNIVIHKTLRNALIIPQRATFEILDKVYVFVLGEDGAAHQREIKIEHELDDLFVIKSGVTNQDQIILEGVQLVRDGQKIETPQYRKPEDALKHLKFHAE